MTILSTDIKLRESERMTDTTDGGGRRTNRLILDGVAGNVFPKVSRVDSVYGRVNLRKLYGHVDTANTDMYAGAHAIITDAPDNNRIHVCAFSTGSDFDTRTQARDRVESYVTLGPLSRMTLYGRQVMGAQAILAYQRVGEPLPEIGEVYALVTGSTTLQFFRLQELSHEVRTFVDDSGSFTVTVLTMGLGAPLLYEFIGIDSPSRISAHKGPSDIRTTRAADAARYYGIQPLAAEAERGALTVSLPSIYTPIVPTTQREVGIALTSLPGATSRLASGTARISNAEYTFVRSQNPSSVNIHLLRLPMPGSVVLTVFGNSATDDGKGGFPGLHSLMSSATKIDYETGILTLVRASFFETVIVQSSYLPAAVDSQTSHTQAIEVTIGTRGVVYTPALLPIPAPGTLVVDYRALGKWYRLRDNGFGELVGGDAAYGTGTVNYVTGGVTITLGALPDVGSSILMAWGSPVHYEVLSALPASEISIQLDFHPVRKTSLRIEWGVNNVAVDNGDGLITGHATGKIDYQTGKVSLNVSQAVVGNLAITFDKTNDPVEGASADLGGAVLPRTVYVANIRLTFPDGSVSTYPFLAQDDGAGALKLANSFGASVPNNGGGQFSIAPSQQVGVVDYATGVITMGAVVPCVRSRFNYGSGIWESFPGDALIQTDLRFGGTKSALPVDAVPKTQSVAIGSSGVGLSLQLSPLKPLVIVEGSLLFSAFGKMHIDRSGFIYSDVDPFTGSGFLAGTINYETGAISLNSYSQAVEANFSVLACLGKRGSYTSDKAFFRTAGSPLRPASTYLQVTALDGELLSATVDQNGNVVGSQMKGTVEQSMGVIALQFGATEDVLGVPTWVPREVMPETIRYSAVVLSNLPLNSNILGLDPVRLPSDGRVPIYRAADVTVIHHTSSLDLGAPSPGSTHSMGRTGLSMLWLQDSTGAKLPLSLYTPNLDAGTVTIAADAVLTGFTAPFTAKHRIEEMSLVTDVQINGQLSLAAPLLRTYPLGSFVSSALLFGDLFARVTGMFDQNTWTGVWSDRLIGDQATAQFNDIDYPIEVLNDACTTERWRLNFTSPTAYQVIGEQLGVIATGSTTTDMQPINQLTGKAFFTIRKNAFGAGGWAAGNQVRFNTLGATPPFWLCRTVLPGATLAGDAFDAQLRGDVD